MPEHAREKIVRHEGSRILEAKMESSTIQSLKRERPTIIAQQLFDAWPQT